MIDPRTPEKEINPVEWALSELATGRLDALRKIVDETPCGDSHALLVAIETLEAVRAAARRDEGWQRVQRKAA